MATQAMPEAKKYKMSYAQRLTAFATALAFKVKQAEGQLSPEIQANFINGLEGMVGDNVLKPRDFRSLGLVLHPDKIPAALSEDPAYKALQSELFNIVTANRGKKNNPQNWDAPFNAGLSAHYTKASVELIRDMLNNVVSLEHQYAGKVALKDDAGAALFNQAYEAARQAGLIKAYTVIDVLSADNSPRSSNESSQNQRSTKNALSREAESLMKFARAFTLQTENIKAASELITQIKDALEKGLYEPLAEAQNEMLSKLIDLEMSVLSLLDQQKARSEQAARDFDPDYHQAQHAPNHGNILSHDNIRRLAHIKSFTVTRYNLKDAATLRFELIQAIDNGEFNKAPQAKAEIDMHLEHLVQQIDKAISERRSDIDRVADKENENPDRWQINQDRDKLPKEHQSQLRQKAEALIAGLRDVSTQSALDTARKHLDMIDTLIKGRYVLSEESQKALEAGIHRLAHPKDAAFESQAPRSATPPPIPPHMRPQSPTGTQSPTGAKPPPLPPEYTSPRNKTGIKPPPLPHNARAATPPPIPKAAQAQTSPPDSPRTAAAMEHLRNMHRGVFDELKQRGTEGPKDSQTRHPKTP